MRHVAASSRSSRSAASRNAGAYPVMNRNVSATRDGRHAELDELPRERLGVRRLRGTEAPVAAAAHARDRSRRSRCASRARGTARPWPPPRRRSRASCTRCRPASWAAAGTEPCSSQASAASSWPRSTGHPVSSRSTAHVVGDRRRVGERVDVLGRRVDVADVLGQVGARCGAPGSPPRRRARADRDQEAVAARIAFTCSICSRGAERSPRRASRRRGRARRSEVASAKFTISIAPASSSSASSASSSCSWQPSQDAILNTATRGFAGAAGLVRRAHSSSTSIRSRDLVPAEDRAVGADEVRAELAVAAEPHGAVHVPLHREPEPARRGSRAREQVAHREPHHDLGPAREHRRGLRVDVDVREERRDDAAPVRPLVVGDVDRQVHLEALLEPRPVHPRLELATEEHLARGHARPPAAAPGGTISRWRRAS